MDELYNKKYSKIISLGYDCTVATVLRKQGKRDASFPFDWTVTISAKMLYEALTSNFEDYADARKDKKEIFVNKYDTRFPHHSKKFTREKLRNEFSKKVKAFRKALSSGEPVLLIRKEHGPHETKHCNKVRGTQEAYLNEKTAKFLRTRFNNPNIDYLVLVSCDKCKDEYEYGERGPITIKYLYHDAKNNPYGDFLKKFQLK